MISKLTSFERVAVFDVSRGILWISGMRGTLLKSTLDFVQIEERCHVTTSQPDHTPKIHVSVENEHTAIFSAMSVKSSVTRPSVNIEI